MAIANATSKWVDGDLVFYDGTTEIFRINSDSSTPNVTAANGITADLTGNVTGTLTGLAIQGGSATAIAASGAIPITTLYSSLDSSGGALAMTLADGVAGQVKIIKCDTAGNDAVVTPAHFKDGSTATLNAADESITLVFDGTNWCLSSNLGAVAIA